MKRVLLVMILAALMIVAMAAIAGASDHKPFVRVASDHKPFTYTHI